jgi:hypothetical protein
MAVASLSGGTAHIASGFGGSGCGNLLPIQETPISSSLAVQAAEQVSPYLQAGGHYNHGFSHLSRYWQKQP